MTYRDGSLVGKKVRISFVNWPVASGTYTYEGRDEKGHWVRRSDGVQRQLLHEFVTGIEVLPENSNPEPDVEF
jgi:hypothetical protein